MTLISLFHMGWHFNYYRKLVRAGPPRSAWPRRSPLTAASSRKGA